MQLINIYFTKTEIGCFLPGTPNQWLSVPLVNENQSNENAFSAFNGLQDLVKAIDRPEQYKFNFVLDQNYISYTYLQLPNISKRKISSILQNELGSYLTNDLSEFNFDYLTSINKEKDSTNCGIYIVKKKLVDNLVSIAKSCSIEVSGIYPLNHFIELDYISSSNLENDSRIFIDITRTTTKMFVFNDGFLAGYSTVFLGSEQISDLVNKLNQNITAIILRENQIDYSRIDTSLPDLIFENEESGSIGISESATSIEQFPEVDYKRLDRFLRSGTQPKFNLLKSNILIFKELKKYSRRLVLTASLFGFCVLLYLSNVGFHIYSNLQKNNELEKEYSQAVETYLPKGTKKINAVYMLKQQIAEYEDQQQVFKKYEKREYQTMHFINDVSLFKNKVKSLKVSRMSFGQNSISILGSVSTITDYDLFQESLLGKYPESQYRIKLDQKSQDDSSILFTAIIRPI